MESERFLIRTNSNERRQRHAQPLRLAATATFAVPHSALSGALTAEAHTDKAIASPSTVAPTDKAKHEEVTSATIGKAIEKMYDAFNRCDANGTAECFTDDVVYEDLLLGNNTLVESREEFRELISAHPVFMYHDTCKAFGVPPPSLQVKVDNLAEDLERGTVGVEWHVEIDGEALQLGRGLSLMHICPETGLISRAVDIAEAPWRIVGMLLSPFAAGFREFSRSGPMWGAAATTSICVRDTALMLMFLSKTSLGDLAASIWPQQLLGDFVSHL